MKPQHRIEPQQQPLDIDALITSARDASGFLKALAHEARLLILCLLIDGEKSVTEIEQVLSLRQPAISQQLARLRVDGLVETRRVGKNVFYSLARPEVREVIGALHRAFCRQPRSRVSASNRQGIVRAAVRAKGAGAACVLSVNWRPIVTPPQSDSKYLVQRKYRSFFKDLIGVQSFDADSQTASGESTNTTVSARPISTAIRFHQSSKA